MLADGRKLDDISLKPGPAADQVVLEGGRGGPVTVAAQDLLVVDFGKVSGRAVTPTVRLLNGDQVYGKVTFPTGKQVRIAAGWGSITVPLAWCSAVRLDEKAPLPAPASRDALVLKNNDRVQGEIQSIAAGKITVQVGGKPVPVAMDRVQALVLGGKPRPSEGGGLLLSLDLGGGERLTGRWVKLTPDVLTIRTEWGEPLDVPVASLSRLEVKNGKLVYLSDLKPTEVKLTPYFDGMYSLAVNRSVLGGPLRLAGKTFARGLGMHSKSDVTYALDGGYGTFAATVGIDDAVGPAGSVVYRVYGDEKLLFESPVMRGGDAPKEISIDVKRVLLLRLEVDYADNGDVADHADWGDARLLRQ